MIICKSTNIAPSNNIKIDLENNILYGKSVIQDRSLSDTVFDAKNGVIKTDYLIEDPSINPSPFSIGDPSLLLLMNGEINNGNPYRGFSFDMANIQEDPEGYQKRFFLSIPTVNATTREMDGDLYIEPEDPFIFNDLPRSLNWNLSSRSFGSKMAFWKVWRGDYLKAPSYQEFIFSENTLFLRLEITEVLWALYKQWNHLLGSKTLNEKLEICANKLIAGVYSQLNSYGYLEDGMVTMTSSEKQDSKLPLETFYTSGITLDSNIRFSILENLFNLESALASGEYTIIFGGSLFEKTTSKPSAPNIVFEIENNKIYVKLINKNPSFKTIQMQYCLRPKFSTAIPKEDYWNNYVDKIDLSNFSCVDNFGNFRGQILARSYIAPQMEDGENPHIYSDIVSIPSGFGDTNRGDFIKIRKSSDEDSTILNISKNNSNTGNLIGNFIR